MQNMSDAGGMIEHMFEDVDEAGLLATIEEATRTEAAAAALRSSAIGELLTRRLADPDDERSRWACDGFDSTAAEVAAVMNISHGKACGQLRIAEYLRDRLPKVASLFAAGGLSARVVASLTWRTRLVDDETAWAQIDTALCERARTWGPMADDRLTSALDALIFEYDPAAVITVEKHMRARDITVGAREDEAGTVSVFGRLLTTDAALFEKKLAAIADTVCDDDPRTAGERRSDALAAMADLNDCLACRCTNADCPKKGQASPSSSVVISVIADHAAIKAASAPTGDRGTAVLAGGREPVPTPLLADLIAKGAALEPLATPCGAAPEPRYRPSAKLAAFVRARDLTCRFPGCQTPAQRCDIDHVVPDPIGPTHPSNLLCMCRKHHLLKTFWVGDWSVTLAADGAATWTSPTGKTYVTNLGSRALFPGWDVTTAELAPSSVPPDSPRHDARMPRRRETREQNRARQIRAERAVNDEYNQKRKRPRTTDPPL